MCFCRQLIHSCIIWVTYAWLQTAYCYAAELVVNNGAFQILFHTDTVVLSFVVSVCGLCWDTLVEYGHHRCRVTLLLVAQQTAQSKYGMLILASVSSHFMDIPQPCAVCTFMRPGMQSHHSLIVIEMVPVPMPICISSSEHLCCYQWRSILLSLNVCNICAKLKCMKCIQQGSRYKLLQLSTLFNTMLR